MKSYDQTMTAFSKQFQIFNFSAWKRDVSNVIRMTEKLVYMQIFEKVKKTKIVSAKSKMEVAD